MLSHTVKFHQTRRNQLVKYVHEHYIRDDIVCGYKECQRGEWSQSKVLLMDGACLHQQMDVWDFPHKGVIILQSVLMELKEKSLRHYERVRKCIQEYGWFVFSNMHHKHCFKERERGQDMNAYRQALFLNTVQWYAHHLKNKVQVVLVSDTESVLEAGRQAQLTTSTGKYIKHYLYLVRQVVEAITDHPELLDKLAVEGVDQDEKKFNYPEHLTSLKMAAGLKSGLLHQGTLQISQHNYLEGSIFAKINDEEVSIVISGRMDLNRAVHGDVVAIKLLEKSLWQTEQDSVFMEQESDEEKEEQLVKPAPSANKAIQPIKPRGQVVGIIKRNWRPYCGTIEVPSSVGTSTLKGSSGVTTAVSFWPFDRRIPKIRIRTRQAANLKGHRIMVAIDSWSSTSKHPMGHFLKTLGPIGDRATETELLLLEHDVPYTPFPPNVLACLPSEGEDWIVKETDLTGRIDLRHVDVCSIDPPGCTDIDDALHAISLPNGNYQVGVRKYLLNEIGVTRLDIADVSHFVKPGNAMDLEASRRGTTVYLVDRRIDMLPSLLGTNLCSLKSHVDRLAFSVVWELSPEAEIISTQFTKSIIRSRHSFTYDEAQTRLDDPTLTDSVSCSIKALNKLAKILRRKRMEMGALVLASPEVRFKLENESQDPVDVEMKEMKDTNALVEEFMLLANISVAKKIFQVFPDSSMLRRHPQPPSSNFESLKQALKAFNLTLSTDTSLALAQSLDTATLPNDSYFNKLVRIMTTRCMMQAVYFCSGTLAEQEFRHYGLASDMYTHFTSPIRRYADLVVHRLLAATIQYDKYYSSELTDKTRMVEVCHNLNYRHRQAQQVSRASVELYTNLYFKSKETQEEGYVIRLLKNGAGVLVPKYGIEGFVHAEEGQVKLFDKVNVGIKVEEAGVQQAQRSKLVMWLLESQDRQVKKRKV